MLGPGNTLLIETMVLFIPSASMHWHLGIFTNRSELFCRQGKQGLSKKGKTIVTRQLKEGNLKKQCFFKEEAI